MRIRFENVWFTYESLDLETGHEIFQLQDLSFEIHDREFAGIVGRSGSGKTTLMQLCNGLLLPNHGRILIDEQDIHPPDYNLAALRRRLGLVFQFPEMQLFAATVSEEVAFGPRQQKLPSEELAQRVAEALDQVGLDESYAVRNPFLLSQGEKRRVALAGVLAMRPEMLILDEPTASLDANGTEEVYALLQRWQTAGKTLVTISHDFELIARFCPRLLILEKGRLVYDGMAASLWQEKPRNPNQNILEKAGLPLPRSERLRRHLTERGFQWQTISILQENSK